MINPDEIKKYLNTKYLGKNIIAFESIDSTNTYAKKLNTEESLEGTIIIAEEQTQGRGRFNRNWQSERGKNLTFTIILQPATQIENVGLLPICTGGIIAKAIENRLNIRTECKWPNDLLIAGKKVCGVLIESVLSNYPDNRFIIGIGVNVNQEYFPDNISETATSLKLECGFSVDRVLLLTDILSLLDKMYIDIQNGNYEIPHQEWLSRARMLGQNISVQQSDKVIHGKALRLDNDGSLVLNCEGKEIKVFSGDVTIIKQ